MIYMIYRERRGEVQGNSYGCGSHQGGTGYRGRMPLNGMNGMIDSGKFWCQERISRGNECNEHKLNHKHHSPWGYRGRYALPKQPSATSRSGSRSLSHAGHANKPLAIG
jgi:hypothetical protein